MGEQFLLFVGYWFLAAAIGNCQLVFLGEPIYVHKDGVTLYPLGLLLYKQIVATGTDQLSHRSDIVLYSKCSTTTHTY